MGNAVGGVCLRSADRLARMRRVPLACTLLALLQARFEKSSSTFLSDHFSSRCLIRLGLDA
jgi:hypothetical protein